MTDTALQSRQRARRQRRAGGRINIEATDEGRSHFPPVSSSETALSVVVCQSALLGYQEGATCRGLARTEGRSAPPITLGPAWTELTGAPSCGIA